MEDEIDLRKYILLLVKNWIWIVGISVLLAVAAFVVSKFVLTPDYQAHAILFIVQPQYSITFDTRFTTQNKTDLAYYGSVDELAEADGLIQEVHSLWTAEGNSPLTYSQIKGMLSVGDSSAVNTIELIATSKSPETAAKLVNIWADVVVRKTEDIYTNKTSEADTLQDQFEQAKTERDAAEQALVDFQEENTIITTQAELTITQRTYTQYLSTQEEITQAIQNIQALQSQISGLPQDSTVAFEDDLTAMFLQMKVYDTEDVVFFNLDSSTLTSTRTVRELDTHLDQLSATLVAREDEIASELPPLQAKILELQSKVTALQTSEEQLRQDYRIASDTYLTLSRKIEETNISNEVTTGSVRLASNAIAPEKPSGPRTLLNTLIAGVLGLFLSVSFFIGRSLWQDINSPSGKPE